MSLESWRPSLTRMLSVPGIPNTPSVFRSAPECLEVVQNNGANELWLGDGGGHEPKIVCARRVPQAPLDANVNL